MGVPFKVPVVVSRKLSWRNSGLPPAAILLLTYFVPSHLPHPRVSQRVRFRARIEIRLDR